MSSNNKVKQTNSAYKLNPVIFWPIVIIMLSIVILSFIDEEGFATVVSTVLNAEVINFKFLVGPITLFMIITGVVMLFHPVGKIRLGGEDAKPKFNTFSYWGMCICSTIAIGIVFYGVAQPMTYFMEPWDVWGVEAGSPAAAVKTMAQNNMEWAWGQFPQYCAYAIVLGLAMFNYKQPARVSSFLYCLNGKPVNNKVRNAIDIICVFGIVSGITGSLGTGTMQMSAGLNTIFGIEVNKGLWLVVEAVVVAGFLLMSIGGIAKGIKTVTDKNLDLYIIVLAFVVVTGPTLYICDMFVESTAMTAGTLVESICYTGGIDGNDGPIFWMIWQYVSVAAFAPVTGLFLAKISYGKTIREVAVGTMLIPTTFVCIWFTVFGSYAFNLQTSGALDVWGTMQTLGMEATMFEVLKQLPGGIIWCVVFLVVIYMSFVTMASSSTTTASIIGSVQLRPVSEEEEPPLWMKLSWGMVMAVSAYVFISYAGIDGAKSMAMIGGMPSLILGAVCAVCVWRISKMHGKLTAIAKANDAESIQSCTANTAACKTEEGEE